MEKFVRTFNLPSPEITSLPMASEVGEVTTATAEVGVVSLSHLLLEEMEQLHTIWNNARTLLEQMTRHLLRFLDEGLDRIQLSLARMKDQHQADSNSSSSSSSAAEKQSKILVFLLARIASLITMVLSGRCQFAFKDGATTSNQSTTVDSEGDGIKNLMAKYIQRLVRACHLSILY